MLIAGQLGAYLGKGVLNGCNLTIARYLPRYGYNV
jgi:hypothetical protein